MVSCFFRVSAFLGKVNQYVPLGLAGSIALWRSGDYLSQCAGGRSLSDVDNDIQAVFKEIVRECDLDPSRFECKMEDVYDSLARTRGNHVVALTKDVIEYLRSEDPQNRLYARSIIKHELGHLYYQDLISRTLYSIGIFGGLYGMNKLTRCCIPMPTAPLRVIGLSIVSLGALYLRSRFVWEATLYGAQKEELRADRFSIQYAKNPQELQVVADRFFADFESHVSMILTLELGTLFGSVRMRDEYERRKDLNQSVRDWVIENRHVPYVAGASLAHPNLYDRANAFSQGAELLRKKESSY